MQYLEDHRKEMKEKYPTMADYKANFEITDEFYKEFMDFAAKEGVKDSVTFDFAKNLEAFAKKEKATLDSIYANINATQNASEKDYHEMATMLTEYINKNYQETVKLRNESKAPIFIKEYLKFEIARTLYNYGQAYEIFLQSDDAFLQAYEVIRDEKYFKKHKIDR